MTADEHHINTAPQSPAAANDGEEEVGDDQDEEEDDDEDEDMDEDAIAGGSVSLNHLNPISVIKWAVIDQVLVQDDAFCQKEGRSGKCS